jgi:transposase
MLTYGTVLVRDNARPHTAGRTRALLEHFNWELFDYSPYNTDLAPSDYNLFTYLKNWLGSQSFNNNAEFMERVRLLRQAYKNLFPDTSASISAVTTLS